MTSILNKAIEHFEDERRKIGYSDNALATFTIVIDHLRSLLPAEKEQRKEDMRRVYMEFNPSCNTFMDVAEHQFETWYKQNEKG